MKRFSRPSLAAAAIALFSSCAFIPGLNSVSSDIFNQLKKTTPVFGATTAARSLAAGGAAARDFSSQDGGVLYAAYYTLRDFNHATDEGVVDRSNLYKIIYDVESVFEGATWAATSIGPEAVAAPFPKIASGAQYEFGGTTANSSVVYKKTGNAVDALVSWKWTENGKPDKDEIGIAKFASNPDTGDIAIDFAFSVDYKVSDSPRDYNNRCVVSGNLKTHEFQFVYRIQGWNIAAKGVSQGSGYMLFKYLDMGTTKYLVVPAGAGMDFFAAEFNAASPKAVTDPALLPASVADYKDWVVAASFFADDDMFDDSTDLTNGGWKLSY